MLQDLAVALNSIKSVRDAPNVLVRNKRAEDALAKLKAIVSLNPPPFDRLTKTTSIIDMSVYNDEKTE